MRRWLTIALGGLVLSCQGPAVVMAGEAFALVSAEDSGRRWHQRECVDLGQLESEGEDHNLAGRWSAFFRKQDARGPHGPNA